MSAAQRNAARAARSAETGAVMVLFAMLLVGLFGMLGVVIDGGRLRVTRQQLDAGAEAAALEGVRFKDVDGDAGRRARAIETLARQWDDDLDSSNGDALGLGAGSLPIVVGAQPLGGRIAITPSSTAYEPAVRAQSNLGNAAHGDLVAGQHIVGAPPREDDAFARADFVPAAPGSTSPTLQAASSFLVRLRRASQRLELDRQQGISSAGPPFEWLWARGSAWQEPGASGVGQSRADGLTVRATAIASTERALVVSNVPNGGPQLGLLALRGDATSAWNTTAPGASLTLDVDAATGVLTIGGVEQGLLLAQAARAVGDVVAATATAPVVPTTALVVPAFATLAGARRVIGFTFATATIPGATITVTRLPSAVLPAGSTSVSPAALDARLALEADPALRALHVAFAGPVLAPVLRR